MNGYLCKDVVAAKPAPTFTVKQSRSEKTRYETGQMLAAWSNKLSLHLRTSLYLCAEIYCHQLRHTCLDVQM